MINIFQHDFKSLVEFAKSFEDGMTKEKIQSNFNIDVAFRKIKADKSFMHHALATLANVKSYSPSASDTILNIGEYTIEGQRVTREEMLSLIGFFYYYPTSCIILESQIKSTYNSSTPVFLYAQRLYNDVMYNSWDRKDPQLKFLLGCGISIVLADYKFPSISPDKWETARVKSVTTSKGERCDFTAYKANKISAGTNYGENWEKEIDALPRLLKHMYLETWIFANPVTSAISDLDDWDINYTKPKKVENKKENDGIF